MGNTEWKVKSDQPTVCLPQPAAQHFHGFVAGARIHTPTVVIGKMNGILSCGRLA